MPTNIKCGGKMLMRERQWADPDVSEDVDAVYSVLMNNYRELSTFERWVKEVESKKLRWGSKLTRNLIHPKGKSYH